MRYFFANKEITITDTLIAVFFFRLLFFAVPAVCAEFATVDADCFYDAFERLKFERGEVEFFAYRAAEIFAAFRRRITVFFKMIKSFFSFELHYSAARYEFHFACRTGEV